MLFLQMKKGYLQMEIASLTFHSWCMLGVGFLLCVSPDSEPPSGALYLAPPWSRTGPEPQKHRPASILTSVSLAPHLAHSGKPIIELAC